MRLRVGDVVEVSTPRGLAYVQQTHHERVHGSLWRVLPGLFAVRPAEVASLVAGPDLYFVFVPLTSISKSPRTRFVGHFDVPAHAQPFPLFKAPFYLDAEGHRKKWWLWDGKREWPIPELGEEESKLPTRQVVTIEQFIDDLARGYRPEDDV